VRPAFLPGVLSGPLAQLVEQLTLNQRVAGSSPARLTTIFGNSCLEKDYTQKPAEALRAGAGWV
jgi:hypothetical protein